MGFERFSFKQDQQSIKKRFKNHTWQTQSDSVETQCTATIVSSFHGSEDRTKLVLQFCLKYILAKYSQESKSRLKRYYSRTGAGEGKRPSSQNPPDGSLRKDLGGQPVSGPKRYEHPTPSCTEGIPQPSDMGPMGERIQRGGV
jgi:hypothetical protein